jgi:hypothetical protein
MGTLNASTGSVTRQFGTYSAQINLDIDGSSVSTGLKLLNIPKISLDADVQDDVSDIEEFKVNLSEITIEAVDRLSNGDSLIEYISELNNSQTIQVQSTVNGGTDYFIAQKTDCSYDWEKRTVKIKAVAALRYDVEVTNYDISSYLLTSEWVPLKTIVREFLSSQGSSPTTVIMGSYFDLDYEDLDTPAEAVTYSPVIAVSQADCNTYTEAQRLTLRLSINEGAMIGSMLGYSYYVRRNYATDTTVDSQDTTQIISASDLKSWGIKFSSRNVNQYLAKVTFQDQFGNAGDNNGTETINSYGTQNISIEPPVVDTLKSIEFTLDTNSDSTPDAWQESSVSSALDSSDYSTILDRMEDSYKKALNIEEGYSIEFEILGIDKLLPFQFITFDTDIDSSVNGKKVRPSKLEYDLENNIIKGHGYIIG